MQQLSLKFQERNIFLILEIAEFTVIIQISKLLYIFKKTLNTAAKMQLSDERIIKQRKKRNYFKKNGYELLKIKNTSFCNSRFQYKKKLFNLLKILIRLRLHGLLYLKNIKNFFRIFIKDFNKIY